MQLNIPLIPTLLFLFAISLVVVSSMTFYAMLGEVNGRRKPDEQFSLFFVDAKVFEIISIHRQLYPNSYKRNLMWSTLIFGMILGLITLAANARFVSPDELRRIRQSP